MNTNQQKKTMSEEKQIKVGQKWLTRDSREATIFGIWNNGTIGIDLGGHCYLADCASMRYKHQIHSYDLVRLLETQPIQPSPGYRLLLPDEPVDRSAESKHQCLDKCEYTIRWVDVGTGPHTTKQTDTFYYQCPIDPGDGYRLLERGEANIDGDEYLVSGGTWKSASGWHNISNGVTYRRKLEPTIVPPSIDPGEGWRLLEVGEVREHGDEYVRAISDVKYTWIQTNDAGLAVRYWSGVYRRRIEPPEPTYRPFASIAEFEPHQDRWVISNQEARRRVVVYTDDEVSLGLSSWQTFKEAFERGCFFADDGTPFGVET